MGIMTLFKLKLEIKVYFWKSKITENIVNLIIKLFLKLSFIFEKLLLEFDFY